MTAEGWIVTILLLALVVAIEMWRRERNRRIDAEDRWGTAWEQGYADGFAFGQVNVSPRIPATWAETSAVWRNSTERHHAEQMAAEEQERESCD